LELSPSSTKQGVTEGRKQRKKFVNKGKEQSNLETILKKDER
jgi:hypothetical protein